MRTSRTMPPFQGNPEPGPEGQCVPGHPTERPHLGCPQRSVGALSLASKAAVSRLPFPMQLMVRSTQTALSDPALTRCQAWQAQSESPNRAVPGKGVLQVAGTELRVQKLNMHPSYFTPGTAQTHKRTEEKEPQRPRDTKQSASTHKGHSRGPQPQQQ